MGSSRLGYVWILCLIFFGPLHTQGQVVLDERDALGGWKKLSSEPRIHFYTQNINGVWWLINPAGNAFISKGVNHISYTADFAPTLGFSPYARVTMKKYGDETAWSKATAERLRSWNFNTVGAWSSPTMQHRDLSFTLNLGIADEAGGDWQYGRFPDVFSDAFVRAAERVARIKCRPQKDNHLLLGYFTDNELRWGADWRSKNPLLIDFLQLPANTEGQDAALKFLQEKYSSLDALNQAWNTQFVTFEDLSKLTTLPSTLEFSADHEAFLRIVAERYFQVCRDAIRQADPNHLILGVRFAGLAPKSVLLALRDYVDIVSFNTYNPVPPEKTLKEIYNITGKPMMLTEFSFKAQDSRLPNTKGAGTPVATQQDRARRFTEFVTLLEQLPFMIGYHWFEYTDEPKEGRFDGENSNYGLMKIDDEPWEILTEEMTRINAGIELVHLSSATVINDTTEHETGL